jgi:hypothetical protein
MRILYIVGTLLISQAVLANTSQVTTIIEQSTQNELGEIDSTTVQTQSTAPSNNEMPAWEQALQPDNFNTTIEQKIHVEGGHSEITSVETQTPEPINDEMPAWEQALQPPATTTITTREKDIVTPDGDQITTIETEQTGPIPAWDLPPQTNQSTDQMVNE